MKQDDQITSPTFSFVKKGTWGWKVALGYDIFMMVLIIINLFCLSANAILMSDFGGWLFDFIHLPELLQFYRNSLRPWVIITESWFTSFLVIELLVRWAIAIIAQHHKRWFFFPFIHWYEILSIIPQLRFLRLLRAGAIAYNLYQHGYKVIPDSWYRRAKFYYHMLLEELTSRIVLTVLDGIKRELSTSTTHKKLIEDLVAHHRDMFATALADILQESLGKELQAQKIMIAENVGDIVNRAIEDTPELTQLLRLIPIVGGRIEQQIQSIGQRLGENITLGLIEPFAYGHKNEKNLAYLEISNKISQIQFENNTHVEKLVESAVFESLEAIRKQVKVKQWQQILEQHDQVKE
ncbi:preprotein translocase subunit SecA [Acinetobacter sp. ANC 4216]|uniref:preprotein translocase subunit SecA n=1 Tax=Acinetobacter sp. ANC 4216 TaxID=2529840 RepID=UPI00103E8D74|nr:preprotein translocase subunit SecA [Acinetobacter sp. ANC 4216]TCB69996.1 preprotein translocase subunit SecA [Acinetobacter sp. ANC 4216]